MFTDEQVQFLKDFADKGLAEEADITTRNAQILADLRINAAREAKLADLQVQAQALIDQGLQEFDTTNTLTDSPVIDTTNVPTNNLNTN